MSISWIWLVAFTLLGAMGGCIVGHVNGTIRAELEMSCEHLDVLTAASMAAISLGQRDAVLILDDVQTQMFEDAGKLWRQCHRR